MFTMVVAFILGFMHPFVADLNFERLHIFLFNLCSGGTILLYFTEEEKEMTIKTSIFFFLSFLYALSAFFEFYIIAMLIALFLAFIVESVRINKFSGSILIFFRETLTVAQKFHNASLLCLSIALLISVFAIFNDEFLKIFLLRKFQLDTFFLGFSFPISLITFSVIFSSLFSGGVLWYKIAKILSFWIINIGVIVFFIFIIMESPVLELVISSILFLSVMIVLVLYWTMAVPVQQKSFLTSGIFFLLMAAVTGVIYIMLYISLAKDHPLLAIVLKVHSFVSLYGWNLTGLCAICRYNDFPIRLNFKLILIMHWVVVLFFAPLGYYMWFFAFLSTVLYIFLLKQIFFSPAQT